MKFYRNDGTGEVFAFEGDGSQDHLIASDLSPMSASEVEAHVRPPVQTQVELATLERAWRDAAVASLLWLRERHRDEQDLQRSTTLTEGEFGDLLNYLQSLRDWPQSVAFPDGEHRPVAPAWIEQLVQ